MEYQANSYRYDAIVAVAALLTVLLVTFMFREPQAHDSACAQFADLAARFEATYPADRPGLRAELLRLNQGNLAARMIVQRASNWIDSGYTANQAWYECVGESI